jgi:NAD(P)-dependent dehydrogenase (short-subunit alcohol dehydrogenase family)
MRSENVALSQAIDARNLKDDHVGKIIAITGAGDGLGRALARRFAADGDTVVLLGRTFSKVKAVADEIGEPHFAVECDVANPDSVRAAFATVAERFPHIDVLINNAGIYAPFTLAEVSDEQVMGQLLTNLAGPIFCSREALPLLRGAGLIINVTSESVELKMPMMWMYAGTKRAVESISGQWEHELESEGVRVTVVRCGAMMDETKTGSSWPMDVAMRFAQENAKVGINMRERPISHYNSVTDAFRAVVDSPSDVHLRLVSVGGSRH